MAPADFTAEEFRARRQRILDTIGDEAVALVQGADYPPGLYAFRQYNEFYYLCGIEVAHAYLLMNGKTGKSTLFLPRDSQIRRDHDRPVPAVDNPDLAMEISGVDAVRGIEDLGSQVHNAGAVYTPFRHGQGLNMTHGSAASWHSAVLADPWDGRPHRGTQCISLLQSRYPGLQLRDLTPTIDEHRLLKSPREIDLLRRAGKLTALGVCEAMRSTAPGVMEFQLDAAMRYHYLAGGALGAGYHAIVASGANAWHGHYSENSCELTDGDWLLCDCGPDFHYYTSDIGRMWPIDGTYSPWQRGLYGFVVEYHKALLESIKPGAMLADIEAETAEVMREVHSGWPFASAAHAEGAAGMFTFRGHLSHCVGMCVHDGGGHWRRPLEPGIVFSVDPQMRVVEERIYCRVEDTVVVTEDGIENLTADAPLELDDVEAMMKEDGLLQTCPPLPHQV
ncbi:aminopeptidase P family protein [bacterium]|nr:aminopeptidase P family protein [bacterium]